MSKWDESHTEPIHDTPAEKDVLIRAMEAAGYTLDTSGLPSGVTVTGYTGNQGEQFLIPRDIRGIRIGRESRIG